MGLTPDIADRMWRIHQATRKREYLRMKQFDGRYNIRSAGEYRASMVPRYDYKDHFDSVVVRTWATLRQELPDAEWIFHNCILEPELVDQLHVLYPTDDPRDHIEDEQKTTLVSIVAGFNVFVTGSAGTGKSRMVNSARATLEAVFNHKKRGIIVCGSTGVAASNVNGATLHSQMLLLCPTHEVWMRSMREKLADVETLFLDEISMVSLEDFYRTHLRMAAVMEALRAPHVLEHGLLPFGGVQLVVVGDFFQLPAVKAKFTGAEAYQRETNQHNINLVDFIQVSHEHKQFARWEHLFAAPLWLHTVPRVTYMVTVKRQRDLPFAQLLTCQLRWGMINDASWLGFLKRHTYASDNLVPDHAMFLYATNREAQDRNAEKMAQLGGPDLVFSMVQMTRRLNDGSRDTAEGNLQTHRSTVTLRIGAMCRLTRNYDTRLGLVNGTMFQLMGLLPIDEICIAKQSDPKLDKSDSTDEKPPENKKIFDPSQSLTAAERTLFAPAVEAARQAYGLNLPTPLSGCGFDLSHSGNGGMMVMVRGGRDSSVYAGEAMHPFAVPRDTSTVHKYTRADGAARGRHINYEEPEPNLTRHFCAVARFPNRPRHELYVLPPAMFTRTEFSRGRTIPLITQVQVPFVAAYASTIHGAQGLSLDAMAVHITANLDPALVYVALSRAVSSSSLYIIGKLPLQRCQPTPHIIIMYKAYEEMRRRALEE